MAYSFFIKFTEKTDNLIQILRINVKDQRAG